MKMTASRLVVGVLVVGIINSWETVVWDWELGDLVRELRLQSYLSHFASQMFSHLGTPAGTNFTMQNYQVAFLNEFRVMMVFIGRALTNPELLVADTFLSNNSNNLRRFRFPQKYRKAYAELNYDGSHRTADREGSLIVDPTQTILIVGLSPDHPEPKVTLVVWVQRLIDFTCSMCTDVENTLG